MRHEPRDEPRPEWAKFDIERWRGSSRYRSLSWQARLISTSLFVWQSQKGPILDEDGELSVAAQGAPCGEVRAILERMSDFQLVDGVWIHPVAMAYYEDAVRQIDARRRGGLKRQSQRESEQDSCKDTSQDSCKESSPLPSGVVVVNDEGSSITVPSKVVGEERKELTLVPVAPRKSEDKARELAEAYLAARHMRLHGTEGNRKAPSRGMLASVTSRMIARLREGYEPELLVSLPVLVADEAVAFMLKDPEILLRTDNPQGGKCHARRYEAGLNGQELGDRQVAILRNIGTLDYVKRSGAKARNWEAGL
jgi:hypothetical protein